MTAGHGRVGNCKMATSTLGYLSRDSVTLMPYGGGNDAANTVPKSAFVKEFRRDVKDVE
jgi:hypothetical protein